MNDQSSEEIKGRGERSVVLTTLTDLCSDKELSHRKSMLWTGQGRNVAKSPYGEE